MNIIYPKRNIVILNNNEIKQVKGGCYCICKEKGYVAKLSSPNTCHKVCNALNDEINKCADGTDNVSTLNNLKVV